jgi:hypothetical protein
MILPLRIELAMTFKAIFLNVWPSAGPDIVSSGQIRRFGLQHTDFARGSQRFAIEPGGMEKRRNGQRERVSP